MEVERVRNCVGGSVAVRACGVSSCVKVPSGDAFFGLNNWMHDHGWMVSCLFLCDNRAPAPVAKAEIRVKTPEKMPEFFFPTQTETETENKKRQSPKILLSTSKKTSRKTIRR